MNILDLGGGRGGALAIGRNAVGTLAPVDGSVLKLYSSSHCVLAMES